MQEPIFYIHECTNQFLKLFFLLFQIPFLPLAWYKFSFCWQDASGILVHPSGAELPLCGAITGMRNYYGDKQGQQFRVWVDRVLSTQTGLDTWLVKFNKWELSGKIDLLVVMIALTIKLMIRCPFSLTHTLSCILWHISMPVRPVHFPLFFDPIYLNFFCFVPIQGF